MGGSQVKLEIPSVKIIYGPDFWLVKKFLGVLAPKYIKNLDKKNNFIKGQFK